MKNVLFILVAVSTFLFANVANAQAGKFTLHAGIGFEPTLHADQANINTPPVSLKIGYQMTPAFSLNAFGGYSSATSPSYLVNDGQLANVTNKHLLFGLRGELRRELSKRFDVYGGAMLGYSVNNIEETDPLTGQRISRVSGGPTPFNPNAPKGQLMYSAFVGGTFYMLDQVGVFAEVGYGVSLLNAGLAFRL
jgi:hypothetical protein